MHYILWVDSIAGLRLLKMKETELEVIYFFCIDLYRNESLVNPHTSHCQLHLTHLCSTSPFFQDPAGIFDLIEVVGNGTYGQVYKVSYRNTDNPYGWNICFVNGRPEFRGQQFKSVPCWFFFSMFGQMVLQALSNVQFFFSWRNSFDMFNRIAFCILLCTW